MQVSKSPMKVKEWKEYIHTEKLPFGLLVYSYADKDSNSGITKNSRMLLMDTFHGVIGFYNEDQIPEIPILKMENLKPMKKKAPLASTTCLKVKSKPVIELKVNEIDEKGKKVSEKWVFTFKNPKVAEDWIRQIQDAKKNLIQRPPMSYSVPPSNTGYTNQPLGTASMAPTPTYSNEILSQSVADMQKSKKTPLPIDQHEALGYNLIGSTVDNKLPINSVYQPPSVVNNEFGNSRLSGTGPAIGSSNIRMTGSVVQPNTNLGSSNISNVNNTVPVVPPSSIGRQGPYLSNASVVQPQPSILQPTSIVQPNPSVYGSGYRNPEPNPVQSRVTPAPTSYSRYSEKPLPNISTNPITISENKVQPKRSLGQSNIGKPPIYESGNDKDWNLQFLNSNNPLQVLMNFRAKAEAAAMSVIDELGTPENKRKNVPLERQPFKVYNIGTLSISVVFLTESEKEYKWLKNQFRNYDHILNSTENRHIIKVPLAAFVTYKGLSALIKARIPKAEQISYTSLYRQIEQLERITKVDKETFKTNGIFVKLIGPKITYIFVDQLRQYIPFDLQSTEELSQLRKEYMEAERQILPQGNISIKKDKSFRGGFTELDEASKKMRDYGLQVTKYFENMDVPIINTSELTTQYHYNGVSLRCLGLFCSQCDNPLIKKYLVSEIASRVCKKMIRSQLQEEIRKMQGSHSQLSNIEPGNMILLDAAFSVLNDIVSQNDRSDRIWRVVAQEVKRKFNLTFSKQDLSVGYFLSSLFDKSGLTFNYQYFIKDRNFFRSPNTLRRQFVTGFKPHTDTYFIGYTEEYKRLNSILNSDPSQEGFHEIVDILGLRTSGLPQFCFVYNLAPRIKWYMGNFISYGSQDYKQVGIYNSVGQEPPTANSIKQCLLAMKWLRKIPNDQNGNAIFEVATDLITFWGGQFHPLLSDLFDFVSGTHVVTGNYEAAVQLAKSSLQNTIKISKANSLSAGEKFYQLGQIYFKMGKKEDALANYQTTREILQANKKTNLNEYGVISLKLAMLNLNFSKNSEAASKALEALRIFQTPPIQQQHMLETYEVLARAYEISNQKAESLNLSNLCSKKLSNISNPKVYERMLKIVLFPHMINLPSESARDVLMIYEQIHKSATPSQATEFLRSQTSEHSGFQFQNKLQKIDRILGEIHNKNLISKYKGLAYANQGEAEQFLATLEAIGTILGDNFVMGVLIEASE